MSAAVLIVEDEATFAKNVASFLARNGYRVARVGTAEEALAGLAKFHPEVLMLDFNLPGMNGLEMMAELRRRGSRAKVILMTAHGSARIAVAAMEAGAFDYLVKPIALGRLKTVLERALERNSLGEGRAG